MTLTALYERAKRQGIDVDYFPMREIQALSFPDGYIAIDVDRIDNSAHEKAILAHELGHCETGSFYNIHSLFDLRERHEYRANKRAFNMLIDIEELKQVFASGIFELWELAEYFDVPCEFMDNALKYYKDIGMI